MTADPEEMPHLPAPAFRAAASQELTPDALVRSYSSASRDKGKGRAPVPALKRKPTDSPPSGPPSPPKRQCPESLESPSGPTFCPVGRRLSIGSLARPEPVQGTNEDIVSWLESWIRTSTTTLSTEKRPRIISYLRTSQPHISAQHYIAALVSALAHVRTLHTSVWKMLAVLDRLSQPHALEPCDALQKFDMWEGFIANGPMAVYVKCEEETNAEAVEGEILLSLDLWRNCVVQVGLWIEYVDQVLEELCGEVLRVEGECLLAKEDGMKRRRSC